MYLEVQKILIPVVTLHKDNIIGAYIGCGILCISTILKWCKLGIPCGFCGNSCIYIGAEAWNSGRNSNSLFSVVQCLARQHSWPFVLRIMKYVAIFVFCVAMWQHNAKNREKLWVGDLQNIIVKLLFAYLTVKILYCENFYAYGM